MNVFHINCNYAGTILHQKMAQHLEKNDVKHVFFVPVYKKRHVVCEIRENVHIVECFSKWFRFFFRLKQFKILSAAQRLFDIRKFQCIHAYTLFTDGNVAMNLSKKFDVPYIVAVRSTDVDVFLRKRPDLRRKGLEIMLNASKVIFLSETYKKKVCERYIPTSLQREILEKAVVIPNGIDDFWFDNVPLKSREILKKNDIRLIYVGRIEKRKNIQAIQKAMGVLRDQGVFSKLTTVGEIFDKKEFDKVRRDPYTVCLPSMPMEKLIEQYRKHDIFIMPSFAETFGLVYAEALSQGLPVIYSQNEGFDGQFEEGLVGYHCDALNVNDIAASVKELINRYEVIQNECVNASLKFKWDEICEKYLNIYNQVVSV